MEGIGEGIAHENNFFLNLINNTNCVCPVMLHWSNNFGNIL